jgi:hypothetical protein
MTQVLVVTVFVVVVKRSLAVYLSYLQHAMLV